MTAYAARLGVGRSAFLGYDASRLGHMLSEADVRPPGQEPQILTLQDCLYLPAWEALYTPDGTRIDATSPHYLDPDLPVVDSLRRKLERLEPGRAPRTVAPPARWEVVDQPVLLMGTAIEHFGHFLTDSLARLWSLDRHDPGLPVLCHHARGGLERPYERAIVEAMGLAHRLLSPSSPTLFRQVLCPLPAIQLSLRVYPVFDRAHRRAAEGLPKAAPPDRPVYLSRRGLGAGHRALAGEDALEARLEREGFAVVRPEALAFPEQVGLFQGDRPVVGAIGSAFHTLLFRTAATPARLGLLADRTVHSRFVLVDAVKPTETAYLHCMEEALGQDAEAPLSQRAFRIDPDLAMGLLDEAGLLGGRSDRGPARAPGDLTDAALAYVDEDLAAGAEVRIAFARPFGSFEAAEPRHGDAVRLFNGRDGEWWGRAVGPVHGGVEARVKGKLKPQPAPAPVRVAAAVRNQAEAERLVERACELGAAGVALVATGAAAPALDLQRLKARGVRAAERSGRLDLVEIAVVGLDALAPAGTGLLFWEEEPGEAGAAPAARLAPLLKQLVASTAPSLTFAVFPRGALTAAERERLRASGSEVPLGRRRLPPETAAAIMLSVWQARAGEFR